MYITLVQPVPEVLHQIKVDLAAAHTFILSCFDYAQIVKGENGRYQYHVGDSAVLIRSLEAPLPERMETRRDVLQWKTKQEEIPQKKFFTFKVRINAVKQNEYKKVICISISESQKFVRDTMTRFGVNVLEMEANDEGSKGGQHRDGLLTIRTVMFSGKIEVNDRSSFDSLLSRGLGRGKAWGCGMVLLK